MLCTFSSCSDLSIYLNYNIYKFHQIWRTKNAFHFFFTHKHSLRSLFGSGGGGRRRGEMASSLTIKESFKGKYSTCKTSAGVNPASIFQRNPFKNFFHSIFFPGKSLVKNSKLTFNFTWKSPIKFFLHFLQVNLL